MRNRVVDHFRVRRTVSIDDIGDDLLVDPGVDPGDEMDAEEQRGRLRLAMRELPNDMRRALTFRLDGVGTRKEIASLMGTSEASVGQLITRGQRQLRTWLRKDSSKQVELDCGCQKSVKGVET